MKSYKSLLCALFVCFLCLSVFSVSANAQSVELPSYYIYAVPSYNTGSSSGQMTPATIYTNDGEATLQRSNGSFRYTLQTSAYLTMYLCSKQGGYLFNAGNQVSAVLENIYANVALSFGGSTIYISECIQPQVSLEYIDGSIDYDVTENLITNTDGHSDLSFTFTPSAEVSKVHITYIYNPGLLGSSFDGSAYEGAQCTLYMTFGEENADKNFLLQADQETDEVGFLSGLLQKVNDIWNSIKNIPQKIQSIIDSILDLPEKIWNFIKNGLTDLFVPDEEFLKGYKDKWEVFLAEKLGAVWQVVEITLESWEDIDGADLQDTIAMPEVTIPLPDDNEFSFGGFDVRIVPEGFEGLATSVKLIAGIVCTLLFVNGLRKRYDEVMGVEK